MSTDLVTQDGEIVENTAISVDAVIGRLGTIQELMRRAMTINVDYGTIPGTQSKPTLLKPGAEKLCVLFKFSPRFRTDKTFTADGHMTVECTCAIHDQSGHLLGESSAMCSTRESKYAYRKGGRSCPECGKAAIIKGKEEYGGGWLCFKKTGGCGYKFADDDQRITGQSTDRVANPDLADIYNTVLRIGEKRAFLAAVRLVTGSSALFDEEVPDHEKVVEEAKPEAKKEPPKPSIATAVQVGRINEILKELGKPEHKAALFASNNSVGMVSDLTVDQASFLIRELTAAKSKSAPKAEPPKPAETPTLIHNNDVQGIRELLVSRSIHEESAVAWASGNRTKIMAELTPEEGRKLWEEYSQERVA